MNESLTDKFQLSSRKRRVAAFFIDHIVLTLLIAGTIFLTLGTKITNDESPDEWLVSYIGILFIGLLIYFSKDTIRGVSLGKWILGIMVRDIDHNDKTPSFWRLFIRNLFLIIWPIEFVVLFISDDKRRLGDKVAKTIVVKKREELRIAPRLVVLGSIGIALFISFFTMIITLIKKSDAYQVATNEIEQTQEILDEIGGIKGYGMLPLGGVSSSNGYGQAHFEIKVLGHKRDIDVNVVLVKEPDKEWQVVEIVK